MIPVISRQHAADCLIVLLFCLSLYLFSIPHSLTHFDFMKMKMKMKMQMKME